MTDILDGAELVQLARWGAPTTRTREADTTPRRHLYCGAFGPGWVNCAACAEWQDYERFRRHEEIQRLEHDDPAFERFIPNFTQWRETKRTGIGWDLTAPGARRRENGDRSDGRKDKSTTPLRFR